MKENILSGISFKNFLLKYIFLMMFMIEVVIFEIEFMTELEEN
jgi:hypothetical protein